MISIKYIKLQEIGKRGASGEPGTETGRGKRDSPEGRS